MNEKQKFAETNIATRSLENCQFSTIAHHLNRLGIH